MATMGAAICMDQGMDCNWVKVIYAATMATTWCNFRKKVGPAGMYFVTPLVYVVVLTGYSP